MLSFQEMELKHYPQEKLKREVLEIVGKYLGLKEYRLFFFGSRVSGKGSERSDIDIGIEGPKPVPVETIAKIREGLENIETLYSIDIVDFGSASGDFKKVAKEKIELITKEK